MRLSVYIAVSLDGYIARTDGGIDWLEGAAGDSGEDFGYAEFMETVDVLVMGRKTFEKVLTFANWPYGTKPVVVLSRKGIVVPEQFDGRIEVMSGEPTELVLGLGLRGWDSVYLDGGETIQAFLRAGEVQRLIVTRIPVLIGSGIPLFGKLDGDVTLRHVATRTFENGFVQSEYAL